MDKKESVLVQLYDLLNDYFYLKEKGEYPQAIKDMEKQIEATIKVIVEKRFPYFLNCSDLELQKRREE